MQVFIALGFLKIQSGTTDLAMKNPKIDKISQAIL